MILSGQNMKSFVFIIVIIILVAIFQVTILDIVKIFNNKPDLLLICVALAALFLKPRQALIASAVAGILKDFFYTASFGINTILFVLWSLSIMGLSKKITLDYDPVRIGLIFIISFLNNVITGLIIFYLGNFIPLGIFLRNVIIGSIYTTAVFVLPLRIRERFFYSYA